MPTSAKRKSNLSEVTDPMKAMSRLGHKQIELPPDMDESDLSPAASPAANTIPVEPTQKPVEPPAAPVAPNTIPVQQSAPVTPVDASQAQPAAAPVDPQAQLLDTEQKRREWQANAERSKAEAAKLEKENALLRQVALNNRAVTQLVGQQQPAQQAAQPQSAPEPKLTDYIPTDEIEDITVADQRYVKYQSDYSNWNNQRIQSNVVTQMTQQNQQQERQRTVEARAQALAEAYPDEFTDPITGTPDYVKIQSFVQQFEASGDDMLVQLRKFQDYRNSADNGLPAQPVVDPNAQITIDPAQIAAANQQAGTVATAPQAAAPTQTELPPVVAHLNDVYGGFVLPPNYEPA